MTLFIFCKSDQCLIERELIPFGFDDFQCPICKEIYSWESGVQYLEEVEDFEKIYLGAKLAGIVREE